MEILEKRVFQSHSWATDNVIDDFLIIVLDLAVFQDIDLYWLWESYL